jgi:superoxide dismutase, Cu-Zn family
MQPTSDRFHTGWRWPTLLGLGAFLVLMPIGLPCRELRTPMPVAWYGSSKPVVVFGSGTLTMPNSTSRAITYNRDLAPIGAAMTATIIPTSEGSTAQLTVLGLLPNRSYAVAAYNKPCGPTAGASGARFQNHPDPAATPSAPSTDPRYANPDNEIWLDVQTDASGAGTAATTVPFVLTDRVPGSIVVHDQTQTPQSSARAGNFGARIACLTLFRR